MTYVSLLLASRRFVGFGFLMTFSAAFGQTYFIALFNAELREAFALGHGAFGTVYAAATLTSAAVMFWAGQLIDRIDLRVYSAAICAGMAVAGLVMGLVPTGSLAFLYGAILLLRLFGQGLMSHTGVTAMARYFERGRGSAIALAGLGHAAGEAVFPLMAVALVAAIGWRETWLVIGGALAIGLTPLVLWLLRGHGARHAALVARERSAATPARRHWSRAEVLRDRQFHLLLPTLLAPSFITTGIFFSQVPLVEAKGWTLSLFAAGFVVYALGTVVAALAAGTLVDRLGATRLVAFVLLPFAGGLVWLGTADARVVVFGYMALAGLSTGAYQTVSNALWAEMYGVAHLGAIRALAASVMVFSSALSPAVFGWLIDLGVSIETIALACAAWVVGAAVLARRAAARAGP